MSAQLAGLFPELLVADLPNGSAAPQLTTQDTQNILRLCKELMGARAVGALAEDLRHNAVEQLTLLLNRLRTHRLQLTGNACRDLLGSRRLPLHEGSRYKAKLTLIGLVERAVDDLDGPIS